MPAKVEMYFFEGCPFCARAKALLNQKGVEYQPIDVQADATKRQEMQDRGGAHTVPQIFINDENIGGCDDLYALDEKGELDDLLAQDSA